MAAPRLATAAAMRPCSKDRVKGVVTDLKTTITRKSS